MTGRIGHSNVWYFKNESLRCWATESAEWGGRWRWEDAGADVENKYVDGTYGAVKIREEFEQ